MLVLVRKCDGDSLYVNGKKQKTTPRVCYQRFRHKFTLCTYCNLFNSNVLSETPIKKQNSYCANFFTFKGKLAKVTDILS